MSFNESLKVSDAMSSEVVTSKSDGKVIDIALKMKERGIGSVVIIDDDNAPIGIVTEGDIVRNVVAAEKDPKATTAEEAMSSPVISITEDIDLEDAARLMASKKIKKLCVVDLDGKLMGILTEGDVVKHASSLISILWRNFK